MTEVEVALMPVAASEPVAVAVERRSLLKKFHFPLDLKLLEFQRKKDLFPIKFSYS